MLKTIAVIFILSLLNGCVQNAALLGPVITGASTGSAFQAGLSYGSGKAVTIITGKSTTENIQTLLDPNKSKEDGSDTENIKALLDSNKSKEDDSDTENIKTLLNINKNKQVNNENANNFFKLVKKVNNRSAIKDFTNQ